jgi:hypothetical protein
MVGWNETVVMGIAVVSEEPEAFTIVYMYAVSSELFVAVASLVRDKIRS